MTVHGRGWTVFCTEKVVNVLLAMPKRVEHVVDRQLCDLAKHGGEAIDAGLPPPGLPLDTAGVHYSFSLKDGVRGSPNTWWSPTSGSSTSPNSCWSSDGGPRARVSAVR